VSVECIESLTLLRKVKTMKKFVNLTALLAAITFVGTPVAAYADGWTGMNTVSANGLSTNALNPNGIEMNGLSFNGGMIMNGLSFNGTDASGLNQTAHAETITVLSIELPEQE
jgi:hypothetical protein